MHSDDAWTVADRGSQLGEKKRDRGSVRERKRWQLGKRGRKRLGWRREIRAFIGVVRGKQWQKRLVTSMLWGENEREMGLPVSHVLTRPCKSWSPETIAKTASYGHALG